MSNRITRGHGEEIFLLKFYQCSVQTMRRRHQASTKSPLNKNNIVESFYGPGEKLYETLLCTSTNADGYFD